MTTTPAVELHELRKRFAVRGEGAVTAVDGLSLTVRPGEIVAFLGPNGAGKSTTIDMLLGLVRPDSGSVRLFGGEPSHAVGTGRVAAVLQSGGNCSPGRCARPSPTWCGTAVRAAAR